MSGVKMPDLTRFIAVSPNFILSLKYRLLSTLDLPDFVEFPEQENENVRTSKIAGIRILYHV